MEITIRDSESSMNGPVSIAVLNYRRVVNYYGDI